MLDDKSADAPLYRQIYEAIRRAILSGEFESGVKLPATRTLAKQIGVARMTVVNAYEQLLAEGYLEGKTGAGTFVAAELPEDFLQTPRPKRQEKPEKDAPREVKFSAYGAHLAKNSRTVQQNQRATEFTPFQHGLPAIDEFPFDVWAKIAQKFQKNPPRELLGYGESAGLRRLREAIAAHLKSARGVRCAVEQIIITNGTQQALDLIGRILLSPADEVWLEDPCYLGARDIFAAIGARVVHVAVDREGFDLKQALSKSKGAQMVYVTPSHQFPLGLTMSLARRLSLLEWARETEAWIIEDDYNSEYRYTGRPLASLQGLDRHGRVIYLGTFSKTIFPALRLGCLVVPPDLVEIFTAARALTDVHSPLLEQAILAEFIAEGHFARHIRRMRALYEQRQKILVEQIGKQLKGFLEISKAEAGMHLVGWLPEGVSDKDVSQKASEMNLKVAPVSAYCHQETLRGGLLLGYAAFTEKQIKLGIKTLTESIKA